MKNNEEVMVFASNLGGFHGAGSAKAAMDEHGALYGLGVGPAGNSYAIPTKDSNIEVLPLEVINLYVGQFLEHAATFQDVKFNVVAIGCGLAGFTPEEIAPMFQGATPNVFLPDEFVEILEAMEEKVVND